MERKKTAMTIFVSDKIDFEAKALVRLKEEH